MLGYHDKRDQGSVGYCSRCGDFLDSAIVWGRGGGAVCVVYSHPIPADLIGRVGGIPQAK